MIGGLITSGPAGEKHHWQEPWSASARVRMNLETGMELRHGDSGAGQAEAGRALMFPNDDKASTTRPSIYLPSVLCPPPRIPAHLGSLQDSSHRSDTQSTKRTSLRIPIHAWHSATTSIKHFSASFEYQPSKPSAWECDRPDSNRADHDRAIVILRDALHPEEAPSIVSGRWHEASSQHCRLIPALSIVVDTQSLHLRWYNRSQDEDRNGGQRAGDGHDD